MKKISDNSLVFVGFAFITWRVILLVIAAISPLIIPVFGEKFPYHREVLLVPHYESWFWVWGNFDGVHYLRIAMDGYTAQFTQAFFPLYPILIRIFGRLILNEYLVAGFLISNIAFVITLYFLYKLIAIDFSEKIIRKTIILLLIFPTSFYFGAIYTEGLFFLFVILSLYFGRKNQFLIASIFGFLASLTRFFGIFLLPALIMEYYLQHKEKINLRYILHTIRYLKWLLLIPFGVIVYMLYLNSAFNNPFYFITAQPIFGAERTAGEIILLPQVIWRYIKIFLTVNPLSLAYFNAIFEFAATIIFIFLAILAFYKTRKSWAVFALFSVIIPTLSGTFSSMPRYVLVAFPTFLVLAQIKNKLLEFLIILVFSILLFVSVILFTRGYWVA